MDQGWKVRMAGRVLIGRKAKEEGRWEQKWDVGRTSWRVISFNFAFVIKVSNLTPTMEKLLFPITEWSLTFQ